MLPCHKSFYAMYHHPGFGVRIKRRFCNVLWGFVMQSY